MGKGPTEPDGVKAGIVKVGGAMVTPPDGPRETVTLGRGIVDGIVGRGTVTKMQLVINLPVMFTELWFSHMDARLHLVVVLLAYRPCPAGTAAPKPKNR